MEASRTLGRPLNWQDFEKLCKKLWGEIWNCPEIKRNGRNGQKQYGVDVYGIPLGEEEYFGIQCKGKDEYLNRQFTEAEITKEIELAKKFKPSLKKLYFATTAVKDAHIEEFVRKKNLENIAQKSFEVHLFSWEDIVDLIEENKHTYDWYVKSINHKTRKSVSVTFQDGSSEVILNPKFRKTTTHFRQKIVPLYPLNNAIGDLIQMREAYPLKLVRFSLYDVKVNLSYIDIDLMITNKGNDAVEDYKVLLEFEGEIQDISDTNEIGKDLTDMLTPKFPNTYFIENSKEVKIIPRKNILVGDDSLISDTIYIKPFPKESEIIIKWKLISKDYKEEGTLKIITIPEIEEEYKDVLVEDPLKVGIKQGEIEEYLVDKNRKN